ncbi:PucR family transcriptional regulator [Spirillospora sp. CA-294931]|uniref:PucR family transcriptional regulator n=1 Tax=Spirillospora sp. CA-294931 TaxID=3240042 RepID=UPI003D9084FC
MSEQVQNIVDGLAARLSRAALLEDTRSRVLAYSEHMQPIDEVRQMSILRRHTSPEIVDRLRALRIHQARGPVRTPDCPHLGMLPRVCVPVRSSDTLLGFLWFIDPDRSMTDEEIALAVEGARRLAGELYQERFAAEAASRRELSAMRDLLAWDAVSAARAARSVAEEARLDTAAAVVALVVRPPARQVPEPDDLVRAALAKALTATRCWLNPRPGLHLIREDHGVLLVVGADPRVVDACADHLDKELSLVFGEADTVVGVGEARAGLANARESYEEAAQAARIGTLIPTLGRTVHWTRLGIFRVLAEMPPELLGRASAHSGLERLFGDESKLHLLETLETYLDLAGNAHAAAERLYMHRATLYYRLQRVEELTAANLKDGSDRLCLHLALKLGRLTGRYRPRDSTPARPALAALAGSL